MSKINQDFSFEYVDNKFGLYTNHKVIDYES